MYSFCPHCGKDIGQEQVVGRMLVCRHCKQEIGMITAPGEKVMVDQTEELIRQGTAARCPQCQQTVALKTSGGGRAYVPHMGTTEPRRMCPASGKPLVAARAPAATATKPSPIQRPPTSKDLSAYITRDLIKVVSCKKDGDPLIEELTLEYLDKSDRVRIQIEALREILGANFRVQPYPPSLHKPMLAVWGNAAQCVVAKKHDKGGMQTLTDAEIVPIMGDVRHNKVLFFQ
jgi:hypothetical protein